MKEDVPAVLREWALHYLQNKDLLARSILDIKKDQDGWDMVVETKTGLRHVLVITDLSALRTKLDGMKDKNVLIVTPNNRHNVDHLIDFWPEISANPKLTLIFVNPYSNLEKKWIIVPHVHDRIIERKALKLGLDSLFMMVEEYKES